MRGLLLFARTNIEQGQWWCGEHMKDQKLQELIVLLTSALNQPEHRMKFIKEFQEKVWDASEDMTMSPQWDTLTELAYDLDFYEPDPVLRAEDHSYYGEERLIKEIQTALEKLTNQQDGL